jgi:hypothetical protein
MRHVTQEILLRASFTFKSCRLVAREFAALESTFALYYPDFVVSGYGQRE